MSSEIPSGGWAIRAQGLGKTYRLYDKPHHRLLQSLWRGRKNYFREFAALSDVSFELARGQTLGIIGRNGAGKSTLLQIICGTLTPSAGQVQVNGRIAALLELGTGFNPEFTGRENIVINAAILGLSQREIAERLDDIIAFADIGPFIDQPVKTYSSGMYVRLAFAVVVHVNPDILIVDEALAVGDQHFQKKCIERIMAFRSNGCTILFCSHSLYHVQRLCDQALWLHQGQVRALGGTAEVVAAYEAHVRSQQHDGTAHETSAVATAASTPAPRPDTDQAHIEAVLLPDVLPPQEHAPGGCGRLDSPHLCVTVRARAPQGVQPHIGLLIEQLDGFGVTSVATHFDGTTPHQQDDGAWMATVTFPDVPLHTGQYKVSAYLFDSSGMVVYDEWKDCQRFSQVFAQSTPGMVRLPHQWS